MKINKERGRGALKIMFAVIISSVALILRSHPREQMYFKKHLGYMTEIYRGSRVPFQSQAWFLLVSRGFSYFPSTFKAAAPHSFPKGVAVLGCRVGWRLPSLLLPDCL